MNTEIKYYVSPVDKEYVLRTGEINNCFNSALKALLITDELFSLTRTEDEISLLIETETSDKYFSTDIPTDGPYRAYSLMTANPGRDEAGILSPITSLLACANIPILSISTYKCNYIFIPAEKTNEFEVLLSIEPEFELEN